MTHPVNFFTLIKFEMAEGSLPIGHYLFSGEEAPSKFSTLEFIEFIMTDNRPLYASISLILGKLC